jgi:NADPH-dependent 2,4-dienoyl-CoA reductase/sulfur reductase-like enzyme
MYTYNRRKNIIVVGGNAAGPAAAAKAKRTDPEANVLLFDTGSFISTGTCELPYVLSGEIKNYQDIIFFSPESFEKEKGVKVYTFHFVEKINRSNKTIDVKNLKSGHKFEQEYDKLILCTGSKAKTIPQLPSNLSNVFTLKSVSDLISIQSYIAKNKPKNVLIIGGGYIGLESADALNKIGCKIAIIEKEKLPMPRFEDETKHLILDLLNQNCIDFIGGASNIKFNCTTDKFISIKQDGRVNEFDMVLTAVGFEPNADLAVSSKLNLGTLGGIKVDQKLHTSDPNIFAAGDCIEITNKITSRPDYIPQATLAQQYGHIAGENSAGGNTIVLPAVKNIALKLFGKSIVSVGLNSDEAKKYNLKFDVVSVVLPNLVKVMPDSEKVFGKILYDKHSKLIYGAEFVGNREVVGYGDLISAFIRNKIKATELASVNYNYTPPLSPFINILSVLGKQISMESK